MTISWRLLAFLFATALTHADVSDTPSATDDPKVVAFYKACNAGDLDEVKNLFGSGAPIDGAVGTLKATPLVGAACQPRVDVVQFLIDHRANLNLPDVEGSTPLLHACWEQHMENALALIDAGADVNLGSAAGRTPLMYACRFGSDRVVEDLISHKVNLDALCNAGPALAWAASANQLSTVKLLCAAGANPNFNGKHSDDFTILGDAAMNNNLEMIDYLVSMKADVNAANDLGETALMAAVDWNHEEALGDLLSHGADPNLKTKEYKTALMRACGKRQESCIQALIAARADVDVPDFQGETALTQAGDKGDDDIVAELKQAGAKKTDVHIIRKGPDGPGVTPAGAYGLGLGAVYAQRDGTNPRILGNDRTPKSCQGMLKESWNVKDKATLLKQLDEMRDHGHHEQYQKLGAQAAAMSDADFAKLLAAHPDKVAKINAMKASYVKWKDRSGLAWDLCRASNLISQGYGAGYLTFDEAWARLLEISKIAQKNFTSWQELSDNFLDGREIWAGQRDPRFEACAKLLLNTADANSPWNKADWKTPL